MQDAPIRPPVIALTMWLNAQRAGHISATDAANACEFITESLDVWHGDRGAKWTELITLVQQVDRPCVAVLPTMGDPSGLPIGILSSLRIQAGAVAIGQDLILYQNQNLVWSLHQHPHTVTQPDHSFSRQMFLEGLERATKTLTSADLIGDRSKVESLLDALPGSHFPPTADVRLMNFMEQATRVRVVARAALGESMAIASRSADSTRVDALQEIDALARQLITAIASH